MTLQEFRKKRRNIEKTNPAPNNMSESQKIRFYSKIAFEWIEQLNEKDLSLAISEERELTQTLLST